MKQEFEMLDADLEKMKSIASQSAPVMMVGGVDLSSGRQMSANRFWKQLSDRQGFVWDSVEPSAKGIKFFLATPKPIVVQKTQTEIEIDKYVGNAMGYLNNNVTDSLKKIVSQLEKCEYECIGGFLVDNIAFSALKKIAGLN